MASRQPTDRAQGGNARVRGRLRKIGISNKPARMCASARFVEEQNAKNAQRSLQITRDPRFEEIEYFKDHEAVRLDRIINKHGCVGRLYPEVWQYPEPIGQRSGARSQTKSARGAASAGPAPQRATRYLTKELADLDAEQDHDQVAARECSGFDEWTEERFSGRINWEDTFRSNLGRLMLDFDLSRDPNCRLNHLDRVHSWFMHEGRKQTRKEKPTPHFLTFDRDGQPLPGSTRDISPPSSFTTLNLAAATMCRCPRLDNQMNIQPPPPPGPSHK